MRVGRPEGAQTILKCYQRSDEGTTHLGTIRHRAEVVEYRVEQHAGALGDRLTGLQKLSL